MNEPAIHCQAFRDQLPVHDDGALAPAAAAAVTAHLEACPACRAELEALRRLSRFVQRYGRPGAQGLGPELRDRIADAALARRRRRPLLRWCAPRLVAAGLGALLAGAGWYGADRLSARGRGEARVGFDGPFAAYLDAAQAGSSPTHLAALRQLERSPAGRILALTRDAGHALDRGNRNSTPHRGRSK